MTKKTMPTWQESIKPLRDVFIEIRATLTWEGYASLNPDWSRSKDIIIQHWATPTGQSYLVRIFADSSGWEVYSPVTPNPEVEAVLDAIRKDEESRQKDRARRVYEDVALATGDTEVITLEEAIAVSDKALDDAYHYGLSQPGTFGYAANKGSAEAALDLLRAGERDEHTLAAAIHDGWGVIARSFPGQPPDKQAKRIALADTLYFSLPQDEKDKDLLVARALRDAFVAKLA